MRTCLLFFVSTLVCFTNLTHAYTQCLDDQKTILLQLRNELIIIDDDYQEKKLVQWNHTVDCCLWEGVECDDVGHVIGLQLDHEGISGGIENSSSLFSLRYLKKLSLARNQFSKIQIPRGISNLTYLTHLNLSNAGFGGQVPVGISLLRRLVSLDISKNWDIHPLNEHFNLTMLLKNLTGLRELHLDNIDISIQGSEWCQVISSSLPHLRILSLQHCNLGGRPHPSLLQLHSLSILRLDGYYNLTTVPSFFAKFSSLTTLSLRACSLEGPFPGKIFQVRTLQELDLSYNDLLNGTIPQLPLSRTFRSLVLRNTNLSGSLPDFFNNVTMLSNIDLSGSKFSGPIPPTLANLTQLVFVQLSRNFFTGLVPQFRLSKNLAYIDLSLNNLNGSLSSMHFEGLSKLVHLDLGYNSLSGTIPQSLSSLPSLERLMLKNNQFNGTFQLTNLTKLVDVDLSHNFLTGLVPQFGFSKNLAHIDLSFNSLSGTIPQSLSSLPSLETLMLNNNQLNGTFQLKKIASVANLTYLGLSNNYLSVDASNATFPKLFELLLASCNMSVFPDFIKQSNVVYLDLSNNKIAGEVPSWIWEIANRELRVLNISCNRLVDIQKPYRIPSSLFVLDLHSNLLQGELLLAISPNISLLYSLYLANNSLTGSIPTSFCNVFPYLGVVDLSFNSLSGAIPPCLLENNEDLLVLNLGGNNISGEIPDKFPVNCNLESLDVSNNSIGGNIPKSLANCKRLLVLNVGNNNINDSFPCLLPSSLRVLVLRSNRFHGEVRCQNSWPNLHIIDIASNNFNSYLHPINFSSWRGMMPGSDRHELVRSYLMTYAFVSNEYYQNDVTLTIKGQERELVKIWGDFVFIDFSCNNFRGGIPDAIGDLGSLNLVNLSHNALTGTIPKSFGKLGHLESLDLSVNQLSGVIPDELNALTFLSVLNLSYNKLVGEIPVGTQIQSFTADAFKGNTGLCGHPLNRSCRHIGDDQNKVLPTEDETTEIEWGYVGAALGYVVGLGSFVWVLLCWHSLRRRYFEKIDEALDRIFDRANGNRRRRRGRGRGVARNEVRR